MPRSRATRPQPATAEPAHVQPAPSQPAPSQPPSSAPAQAHPAQAQPTRSRPARTRPAETDADPGAAALPSTVAQEPSAPSGPEAADAPEPRATAIPPEAPSQARDHRPTKIALLQRMLRQPEGADLAQLGAATGWQAHTVRAALTRLRQAGQAVERARSAAGATTYRIGEAEVAGPTGAAPSGSLAEEQAKADVEVAARAAAQPASGSAEAGDTIARASVDAAGGAVGEAVGEAAVAGAPDGEAPAGEEVLALADAAAAQTGDAA